MQQGSLLVQVRCLMCSPEEMTKLVPIMRECTCVRNVIIMDRQAQPLSLTTHNDVSDYLAAPNACDCMRSWHALEQDVHSLHEEALPLHLLTGWLVIGDSLHGGQSAYIYVTRLLCLRSTKDDVAASGAYAELQSGLHPGCSLTTIDIVCHCHCSITHWINVAHHPN